MVKGREVGLLEMKQDNNTPKATYRTALAFILIGLLFFIILKAPPDLVRKVKRLNPFSN